MFLIIIAYLDIGTKTDSTAVGRQKFIDHFQDCGLAGAVIADDGYVFSLFNIKGQIFKQCESTKGFGKLFHMQHIIAADASGFQPKVHICTNFCRLIQYFYFI